MKTHVILLTYGEPPTSSFVDQLVYSWRILLGLTRTVAPIPKPVIPLIALSRGWGRYKLWSARKYGSPLEKITEQQAASLRTALKSEMPNGEWQVHVAYEFRRPLLADVVAAIPSHEPVSIVPMYVTDSAFTHGLSRQNVANMLTRVPRSAPVTVVSPLNPDQFADLAAAHVLRHVGEDVGPATALALAAHGTLLKPEKPIDTGLADTERVCKAIEARLANRFGFVINGWLNHSRGGKWTEPAMDEALRRVRDAGFEQLVYFPYGFLADNAESELEGRMAVEPYPGLKTRFIPCLNESAALARAIAAQVTSRELQPLT